MDLTRTFVKTTPIQSIEVLLLISSASARARSVTNGGLRRTLLIRKGRAIARFHEVPVTLRLGREEVQVAREASYSGPGPCGFEESGAASQRADQS